jgi:hypothetical protein
LLSDLHLIIIIIIIIIITIIYTYFEHTQYVHPHLAASLIGDNNDDNEGGRVSDGIGS